MYNFLSYFKPSLFFISSVKIQFSTELLTRQYHSNLPFSNYILLMLKSAPCILSEQIAMKFPSHPSLLSTHFNLIHLSIQPFQSYPLIHQSIHPVSINSFIFLSIQSFSPQSIFHLISPSIFASIHPYFCPSIHICVHPSIFMSIYPYFCPSIHICVHPSIFVFIPPYLCSLNTLATHLLNYPASSLRNFVVCS